MGDKTAIEWTDATWNPIVGCSRVSDALTSRGLAEYSADRWRITPTDPGVRAHHHHQKRDQP